MKSNPQAEWVADYDLKRYPGNDHSDEVYALIHTVMRSSEQVTIFAIGPFTTIAEALRREPKIAKKSRIVAMAGNIRKPYGDANVAIPEYNVKIDVPAAQKVFWLRGKLSLPRSIPAGFCQTHRRQLPGGCRFERSPCGDDHG